MLINKLKDCWAIIKCRQYFLVAELEGKTMVSGMNDETIREAQKWFHKVLVLAKKSNKKFLENLMEV